MFGPRLFTSGPSLNGRSVSGPRDARRQVRDQAAAGYDFIKVHPGLSSDEFEALAETANELGIPYAGHVPVAAGLSTALRLNMATIDHLDGYFVALLPPGSHRSGGYGMQAPRVHAVAPGRFAAWMKSRGKLGGQHKVPRIINDADLFASLRAFMDAD